MLAELLKDFHSSNEHYDRMAKILSLLIKKFGTNNKLTISKKEVLALNKGGLTSEVDGDALTLLHFDTNEELEKYENEKENSCEHCADEEEKDDDENLAELIKAIKKKGAKVQIVHVKS